MQRTITPPSEFLLTGMQAGINRVLSYDIETRGALAQLEGKIIALEITGPGIRVYLQPEHMGVILSREQPGPVDVSICGRPAALLGMVMRRDESRSQGHVEIRGDIHLAQRLQQIMQSLDIDWEEFVATYTGDMAAHHIGRIGRGMGRYLNMVGRRLAVQFSEYVHYEQNMLPLRAEIDQFINEVDSLRDDVERLQQRLKRVERQRGGQS